MTSVLTLPSLNQTLPPVSLNLVMSYGDSPTWSLRDDQGIVYHLAPAPDYLQTRYSRNLSDISKFQLSENPLHLTYSDPLQATPEGYFQPNVHSLLSGNTRYLTLVEKAEDNLNKFSALLAEGTEDDLREFMDNGQWTFDPIVVEFVPEEKLQDPKFVLQYGFMKNAVAPLNDLDKALAYYNVRKAILDKAKAEKAPKPSESDLKMEIARHFGKTEPSSVMVYLKLYEWMQSAEMAPWIEALEEKNTTLSVLSAFVTANNKLVKAGSELTAIQIYNMCYEAASANADTEEGVKITRKVLDSVIDSISKGLKTTDDSEESVEDGSIDSDGTENDLSNEDEIKQKSEAKLEQERIRNLTPEEVKEELPQAIDHTMEMLKTFPIKLPEFDALNAVLTDIQASCHEFKIHQWKAFLQRVSSIQLQLKAVESKLATMAVQSTEIFQKALDQHAVDKETARQQAELEAQKSSEDEEIEALADQGSDEIEVDPDQTEIESDDIEILS